MTDTNTKSAEKGNLLYNQSQRIWSENGLYWRIPAAGGKLTFPKVYSRSQCCAVQQKLLQSAMRQWTASWCILVARQAVNLHQEWFAQAEYHQWLFHQGACTSQLAAHQQCAAVHCWLWILSAPENLNLLLQEFYQSPPKNLVPILVCSLFQQYIFRPFIQ